MRIGLVTADFFPNVGGVAAHVVELGRALAQIGHEVHVFTLPLGQEVAAESQLHGMTVHRPRVFKGKPFFTWGMHRVLTKYLHKHSLDFVHVHGLRPLEATRGLPVPVIFTNHTSGFLQRIQKGAFERWRVARRMSHLAAVLAPSHELAQATIDIGYQGRVEFVANGVDVQRFQPAEQTLRATWGVQPDEVALLLARRLVEKNGVCVFANAINRLVGQKIRVIFAGDGAERPAVEAILRAGGMHDRCVFLGNIPNAQMPQVYQSADISVLPSFYEATSITGLESMACGLPLIGTRVGGIPTLIQHGDTGLLVEPHSPQQLADSMSTLVSDAATRSAMGAKGRQRACDHFSWTRIAEQTAAIYSECLRSNDLRRAG